MAGLGDVFATDYEAVKGGKTKISKAILGRANDIFSSGLLEDKAKQINAGLRESMGMNNTDALYAMRNLDAMAGGDLKQNRQINEDQLTRKGVEMALNFNPAAVGQTVWHGSPHKFDKFDMSKIGTGEGAQAYGNGLYFAENPGVAKDYLNTLSDDMVRLNDGTEIKANIDGSPERSAINSLSRFPKSEGYSFDDSYKYARSGIKGALRDNPEKMNRVLSILDDWKRSGGVPSKDGALYKVDIPDESVSKMLDWDKPLSQQHHDVQQGILKAGLVGPKHQFATDDFMAGDFIKGLRPEDQKLLYSQGGIPGIRYLDGGSRGQQAGTSNFVLFDDQMPRILEVNGQATGAKPWKPGEYFGTPQRPLTEFEQRHLTAQKNAALPVEQGGLGLPVDNTAMQRADAMGFNQNLYHGRYSDYDNIKDGRTFYATPDPSYASIYAMEPTASSMSGKSISDFDNLKPNVMPVMVRSGDILDTRKAAGKKVFDKDFYMQYGNGVPLTEKRLPDWVDAEDFGELFADKGMKYKGVYADEGNIPTWDGGLKDRGVSTAVFDPSAVRSRFAAFDPMRRHDADLLGNINPQLLGAMGVGSVGAAAAATQIPEEYKSALANAFGGK